MKKIRSIIVDDEKNGRENLLSILEKHCPNVHVVANASSAVEAINAVQDHLPDLVFLDIEMPGGNGFEVLKFFKTPPFRVIFITAYDHYAIQAVRFSALDYILKPIDILNLKTAINRFLEQKDLLDQRLRNFINNHGKLPEEKKLALPCSDKIDYVEIKHIIKCRGESNYTRFYLDDSKKEILVSRSLVEFEEILSGFGFIRIHKTHMVNIRHVKTYVKTEGGYLIMSDNSMVPLSRRKKEYVLEKLNLMGA